MSNTPWIVRLVSRTFDPPAVLGGNEPPEDAIPNVPQKPNGLLVHQLPQCVRCFGILEDAHGSTR